MFSNSAFSFFLFTSNFFFISFYCDFLFIFISFFFFIILYIFIIFSSFFSVIFSLLYYSFALVWTQSLYSFAYSSTHSFAHSHHAFIFLCSSFPISRIDDTMNYLWMAPRNKSNRSRSKDRAFSMFDTYPYLLISSNCLRKEKWLISLWHS